MPDPTTTPDWEWLAGDVSLPLLRQRTRTYARRAGADSKLIGMSEHIQVGGAVFFQLLSERIK